ncbi:MAG TPA: prolipoprotein diacylglyceryl transferase [Kofleriaceae bacterium]|nr:prolipoprotein diacylglyceryl transferase [Kofleriaceae bacterium]
MHPTLLELDLPLVGHVEIPAYLTMVLAGFLVATAGARRAAARAGVPPDRVVDLAILTLVLGVLGARLLAVATDGRLADFVHLCTDPPAVAADDALVRICQRDEQCGWDYRCNLDARDAVLAGERTTMCHPPRDCLAALKFWHGGLTFYGALILAVPGALWYCRRRRLDFLQIADLAAPFLLVGQAIGRIGCFLDGCCYGAATGGPLGVVMPGRGPVHPTQLYESAACLVLGAALWLAARRRAGARGARGRGAIFGWALVLYGAARALIELVRADPRGAVGPLSTSQILAIPAVVIGALLIARARRSGGAAAGRLPSSS